MTLRKLLLLVFLATALAHAQTSTPTFDVATIRLTRSHFRRFTAIQEQLGLKLEPAKEPVSVLVIDHVDLPTSN